MSDDESKGIPPGFYTRATLPPISAGARAILERLRTRPRAPNGYDDHHPTPDVVVKRPPLHEQVIGLRPTEKLQPSIREEVIERYLPRRSR